MFKAPFSFDGRIRRIEYFLSGLIASLVGGVAWTLALFSSLVGMTEDSLATATGGSVFALVLGIVAYIVIFWFGLAQGIKRLHDMDKSGWLILLLFVPVLNLFWGLYMLFADGTVGPNPYGADPKNRMPYQQQPTAVNVTVTINKDGVETGKTVETVAGEKEATEEKTE